MAEAAPARGDGTGEPVAVGIDVGGTKLVAATVTADGRTVARRRLTTPARDAARLVPTLRELLDDLDPGAALPVGVGIAGTVDRDGVVRYGPNIGVRDLPLAAELAATGRTVAVANDANVAALAEQRVGAGRGHDDVVVLTLGTGVGGGLVVGGHLVLGTHGLAGELGHLIVAEGGRRCPCGNRGCLEAYASGTAIGMAARERLVDPEATSSLRDVAELTGRTVTEAAVAGDALAQDVLTEVGTWLGTATAGLVNALDPSLVLLGGGAAQATAPWVVPAAETALATRALGAAHRDLPPIRLAGLHDDAGCIGAALLAAERAGTRPNSTSTSVSTPDPTPDTPQPPERP